MDRLTRLMHQHHGHCDEVFAAAEAAARAGDWSACGEALQRFRADLLEHLDVEEGRIFPAFESHTGNATGPTRVMRSEHEQMRKLFGDMEEKLSAKDGDGYLGLAETLMVMMQQHNMKEEQILYRMMDQAFGGEAASMLERAGAAV